MSTQFYLRVEAVNLDHFIDDTMDLNTVRGAGLALLNSVDHLQDKFATLEKIMLGASIGLFKIQTAEPDEAQKVRDEVADFLEQGNLTKHATFSVDVTDSEPDEFHATEQLLTAKNRFRQMQSPSLTVPTWNFESVDRPVCELDRVRPAIEGKYSQATDSRRSYGRNNKQDFYKSRLQNLNHALDEELNFTSDFSEIAVGMTPPGCEHLDGKIAVIYVDGNGFGKIRRQLCRKEEEFAEFSKNLRDLQDQLLADLLTSKVLQDSGWTDKSGKLRIETLLWGGDEMMWVVPAWQGWQFLKSFFEFSKEWNYKQTPLTHGAGVVFCSHRAHIDRVKRLAYSLADYAKEDGKKSNDIATFQNRAAYQALESFEFLGDDPDRVRRPLCILTGQPSDLVATPELVDSVSNQLEKLKADPDFPRGWLHDVYRQLIDLKAVPDKAFLARISKEKPPSYDLEINEADDAQRLVLLNLIWDYAGLPSETELS